MPAPYRDDPEPADIPLESLEHGRPSPDRPHGDCQYRSIVHSLHTFCAEPLHPFGDGLRRRVELVGRVGLAQPTFHHASGHRLSTFRRQRRILVDVHLVSPWNTEASQPQPPRFRPDGQPPERPHLGRPGSAYGWDRFLRWAAPLPSREQLVVFLREALDQLDATTTRASAGSRRARSNRKDLHGTKY
jgi:hypothetical protein